MKFVLIKQSFFFFFFFLFLSSVCCLLLSFIYTQHNKTKSIKNKHISSSNESKTYNGVSRFNISWYIYCYFYLKLYISNKKKTISLSCFLSASFFISSSSSYCVFLRVNILNCYITISHDNKIKA